MLSLSILAKLIPWITPLNRFFLSCSIWIRRQTTEYSYIVEMHTIKGSFLPTNESFKAIDQPIGLQFEGSRNSIEGQQQVISCDVDEEEPFLLALDVDVLVNCLFLILFLLFLLDLFEFFDVVRDGEVGLHFLRGAGWDVKYEGKCWRQMGQLRCCWVALRRQEKQNVCPQGRVAGRRKVFMHTGQTTSYTSSCIINVITGIISLCHEMASERN